MPSTTSQYMGLTIPTVNSEPGPAYANDINGDLTLIDQHNHTTGSGTPVPTAGLNINADLTFASFNAINLRSARFAIQGTPLSAATDLGCAYVSGVDLYYNDANGNQVRLTQSGAVAGTPGSIGGLLSPASVTYSSGSASYIFQSSTATPGNLDAGSVIVREVVANGKGVTLSAHSGLANNYTLTFPATLPSTSLSTPIFMTVDSSGNLNDSVILDNVTLASSGSKIVVKDTSIIQQKMGIRGSAGGIGDYVISSGSGAFASNSVTFVAVTNLSVNLTTLGNPVCLTLVPDSSSALLCNLSISTGAAEFIYGRNGTGFCGQSQLNVGTGSGTVPGLPPIYDFPPAGTYTYALNARVSIGSNTVGVNNMALLAYEIK